MIRKGDYVKHVVSNLFPKIERRILTMGRYIVCKSPVVRLDLMVKKELHAQLVSYFERTGCTYEKEDAGNPGNGEEWVCLKNIEAKRGSDIGELLGLFYALEWGNLVEGHDDKFYIIMNAKKKGKKKNVREDRKEADSGSESRNPGEPYKSAEPGQVAGTGREYYNAGTAGPDDPGEQPGIPSTCDGRCE